MLQRILTAALFVAISLAIGGCQNGVLKTVRKVTYPPDFNYVSGEELKSTMQSFAWYTTLLDNNLRDAGKVTREQRFNSIEILRKMEKLAVELGEASLSPSHQIVSHNIDQFRERIVDARRGLEQEPPNYYLAGAVSGYCLNCHSRRN